MGCEGCFGELVQSVIRSLTDPRNKEASMFVLSYYVLSIVMLVKGCKRVTEDMEVAAVARGATALNGT